MNETKAETIPCGRNPIEAAALLLEVLDEYMLEPVAMHFPGATYRPETRLHAASAVPPAHIRISARGGWADDVEPAREVAVVLMNALDEFSNRLDCKGLAQ